MMHSFDHWRATNPDDEFLGPDPEAEEELPEPVIDEEWNPGRGEYTTTVTFGSGAKYAVRQAASDEWEIHGPDGFYMTFANEPHAMRWLTDIEHWGVVMTVIENGREREVTPEEYQRFMRSRVMQEWMKWVNGTKTRRR